MGAMESKSKELLRRNSSASSFARSSYASPDYRINSPKYATNRLGNSNHQQHRLGYGSVNSNEGTFITRKVSLEHTMLLPPSSSSKGGDIYTAESSSLQSSSFLLPNELDPPSLSQWFIPALICAFAYALYNIFIKKGSESIHPILGGVVLQCVAASIGSILCLTLTFGPAQEEMFYDGTGLFYAFLAGAAVGTAEIISFIVSGMGVPAVQSIPVIIGGSVMFGTIIGRIFLAEVLSPRGWFGVIMIAGGISLVGMEG